MVYPGTLFIGDDGTFLAGVKFERCDERTGTAARFSAMVLPVHVMTSPCSCADRPHVSDSGPP
jgi:hypothetical protein